MSDNQDQPKTKAVDKNKLGKFDFNTMLQQLWNGSIPLMKTFWLYYFAVIFALKVASGIPGLGSMFILLQLVWAGFMVKPIWVAADKYKGPAHWALLAKAAAILIGLAVVGDLLS